MLRYLVRFALLLCLAIPSVHSQTSAPSASAVWNTLSAPGMDAAKSAHVENVEIVRDRIHVTLSNGTIQFAQPVNGVTFAAVFHGSGHLRVIPPNPSEAQQLILFTKQPNLDIAFADATFSFTDGLLDDVAKQVKWQLSGPAADDLYATRQKDRESLGAAYLPRLFKGVMSGNPAHTAFFLADLKTPDAGWVEAISDAMQPEQIRVGRWRDVGPFKLQDIWMSFPAGTADQRHVFDDPLSTADYTVPTYQISANAADNADLTATTHATVKPRYAAERVLLFTLDSNLRVSAVKDSKGQPLEYFQARETKDRYQSYGDYIAVALSHPTSSDEAEILEFQYGGKRVVRKVGDGNYFCESFGWFPTLFQYKTRGDEAAFRSDFDLTFTSPKRYELVATGHKISDTVDGNRRITNWKSDVPLPNAGFAYGDYKTYIDKVGDVDVQVFANKEPDDLLKSIQNMADNPLNDLAAGPNGGARSSGVAIGQLTPAALVKPIGIETSNTLKVFQSYFGPYPYKQLAVTNIVGDYGQGWPGLLYLSWLTFLDSTQRHALGVQDQEALTDFFRAHESSHQWWGNRVGWKSYHDQWLSEGFADFSGILYVQYRQSIKESLLRWRKEKEHLRNKDQNGHTIELLGPITMGQRIASSITGPGSYQDLIYSKGAYVLYMLRMQLVDPRSSDPDHLFKDMMQDYCKTFDNKAASTEDFKAIVEKHMLRSMDLDGNHKMDWFFNEYVYGIGEPQYTFHATIEATSDGKTHVKAQLTRAGVADTWKDFIPLYVHVGDKTMRIGNLTATHPTEDLDVVLPIKVDRVSINDYEDLLADVKQ
jgi:Peptidase family M1 domain